MSTIKPFKGICYNPDKVVDLSRVICPPYDVIDGTEHDFYYQQSPFNFVRLILNKHEKNDTDSNNRYTRAAILFEEWLQAGILRKDEKEALYFYKQDFSVEEQEFSRLGIIGLMEIKDDNSIFPHENTHLAPKMDRFELLKKVKANLSPIFTVFSDKKKVIEKTYKETLSKCPADFCLKDDKGVRHSIWRITDKKTITDLMRAVEKSQTLIADGHHRYEVARMYRAMMQKEDKTFSSEKSYNFVLTYFTGLESNGLCIFPTHRVIRHQVDKDVLKKDFNMQKLGSLAELDEKILSSPKKKCVFGALFRSEIYYLELKDKKAITEAFVKKECFRDLDVALLDNYVLTELLKIEKKDDILYTTQMSEARAFLDSGAANAAFIVRPTTIKQVREVALCGERMPQKSTYFYPKLLSGLVVHKF